MCSVITKCSTIKNTSNTSFYASTPIFKGHFLKKDKPPSKLKPVIITSGKLVCASWIIFNAVIIGNFKQPIEPEKKNSKINEWGPNIRVMASVGQNSFAASNGYTSYLKCLSESLESDKINTIEQAGDSLIKNGYRLNTFNSHNKVLENLLRCAIPATFLQYYAKFYPVTTPGNALGIFDKTDKDKDRFVLIFYDSTVNCFVRQQDNFRKKIKDIYKLKDTNIVSIGLNPHSNLNDFKNGIDSVSEKINRLANKKIAELLIVYEGHGNSKILKAGDEKFEGAKEGMILNSEVTESGLRKIFNEKLKDIKTLFINTGCNSGAWITQETKPLIKSLNRYV